MSKRNEWVMEKPRSMEGVTSLILARAYLGSGAAKHYDTTDAVLEAMADVGFTLGTLPGLRSVHVVKESMSVMAVVNPPASSSRNFHALLTQDEGGLWLIKDDRLVGLQSVWLASVVPAQRLTSAVGTWTRSMAETMLSGTAKCLHAKLVVAEALNGNQQFYVMAPLAAVLGFP